jgi:hypothetical protein
MTHERRPEGGARSTSRRVHPNSRTRRTYPRCPECGSRFPTAEFLQRHLVRDCHGLGGVQLSLDDALTEETEGFDSWDVFAT